MVNFMLRSCLFILALGLPWSAQAGVRASVDRDTLVNGESFRITFEVDSDSDTGREPDFSPLEHDFRILGRSKRSNIAFVNGRLMRSSTWILNLMATGSGTLTIPSIDFGSARSEPLTLIVRDEAPGAAAGAPRDLFLEAEATPTDVWVQGEVVLKLSIWRTVEMNDAELGEIAFEGGTALVKPLGADTLYQARRDGRRYSVVERRFALYPQSSGTLTIKPVEFQGQIVEGTSSFLDPFGQRISTRRLRTEPLRLEVRPAPPATGRRAWLPARRVEIQEVWSDDAATLDVGEAVSRTVALTAEGLTAGQLPELLGDALPDGLKRYPEQPELQDRPGERGFTGVRIEKVALIPGLPGNYVLPAIEIPWWNVATGTPEIARLPERRITVVGPMPTADAAPTPAAAAPVAAPALPRTEATLSPWPVVSAGLAVAWLATLAAWWFNTRPRPGTTTPAAVPRPSAANLAAVQRAVASGDAVGVRDALLAWARVAWPADPPATLAALGRRVTGPARTEISRLDAALYGRAAVPFDGATLVAGLSAAPPAAAPAPASLEPLFRA